MNVFTGEIAAVAVQGSLSLVQVSVGSTRLFAIVIDTPTSASYLAVGTLVQAIFKETEVIIGVGADHRVSLQNKLPGSVQSIEAGTLLSRVTLETVAGKVVSIITTQAVEQLGLREGTDVTAMIKTNEMMLSAC